MKHIIFLLLFLLLPSFAWAKVCEVGYYGIQHPFWPCEESIRALDPCSEIKIAFLAHTFGDETVCLQRLLEDRRVTAVEIHLINERCDERPGGCGNYEFSYGIPRSYWQTSLMRRDPPMMARVGLFFTQMAGKFIPLIRPETVCWVSPVLESNLNPVAFQPLAELAHWQFFQRCHVVMNALKPTPTNFIMELHGSKPHLNAPCIADLDGQNIALDLRDNAQERRRQFYGNEISENAARQYIANYRKCGAAFLWIGEWNLREPRFLDPRARRPPITFGEATRRAVSLFP